MERERTKDGYGFIIRTCDGKTVERIEYFPIVDSATIYFTDGTCIGVDKYNGDFKPE